MKLFLLAAVGIAAVVAGSLNTIQRSVGGGRIINGSPAAPGQFPWQVAVYFETDRTHFCGGSLIDPQWVLTAGHCASDVADPSQFTLYAGLTNLNDAANPITVSQAIVHSGYDSFTLENDIALLQLSSPLTLDDNIQTIALGESTVPGDTPVTVSGWGKTSDASTVVSPNLNYVDLITLSNAECDEYYGEGATFDGMICAAAGDPVKSTCNGDSGGPLVTDAAGTPTHVAVVSFVSNAGCESGFPSGYTRTASYRDWIRENSGV